ncbi:hypothetical protein [Microcoleus vaginatus]|uniref:hypothetical protein n=1 Tax=Microcoleus vaginatus TaxID=119532 RepID=UPI00020D150B|nr:hypothetical protein MicvaDRAFT_5217 [Microcoleus vaginatus FGP-2]
MLKAWGFHEPKLPRIAVRVVSTDPQAWLSPELAAHPTTTATFLSIGTNVKIMSIY